MLSLQHQSPLSTDGDTSSLGNTSFHPYPTPSQEERNEMVKSLNEILEASGLPLLAYPRDGLLPFDECIVVIHSLLKSNSTRQESVSSYETALSKSASDNKVLRERVARLSRELKAEERACAEAKMLAEKHMNKVKEIEGRMGSLEAQLRTIKKDYEKAVRSPSVDKRRESSGPGIPLGLPCKRCVNKAKADGSIGDCDHGSAPSSPSSTRRTIVGSPVMSPKASWAPRIAMSRNHSSTSTSPDTSRRNLISPDLRSPQPHSKSILPLSPKPSPGTQPAQLSPALLTKRSMSQQPSMSSGISEPAADTSKKLVTAATREVEFKLLHLFDGDGDEQNNPPQPSSNLRFEPVTLRSSDPTAGLNRSMIISNDVLPSSTSPISPTNDTMESLLQRQANLLNMLVTANFPQAAPTAGLSRPVSPYSFPSFAEQQESLLERQRLLETQRREITLAAVELARERQAFRDEREEFFKDMLSAETEKTLRSMDSVLGDLEV
ncbi:hypothetical protein HDU67_010419 [Dinochytrium kinnereticum]|nr:hypothetical protein HDU67_010419 [Dinochytrium kinnereticum]